MGRLGVIRLKYVQAFRDRMGRMRYYFRRHGIRTALPGLPGSDEFMAVYAAQLEGTCKARRAAAKSSARNILCPCHPVLRLPPISISISNKS
jgi:hypothetical protein